MQVAWTLLTSVVRVSALLFYFTYFCALKPTIYHFCANVSVSMSEIVSKTLPSAWCSFTDRWINYTASCCKFRVGYIFQKCGNRLTYVKVMSEDTEAFRTSCSMTRET